MASFFRRVTENWKLKTLAFAIAVLLWVVVSSEQVTSDWIPVPLIVDVTDSRYRANTPDLTSVEVRFQGSGRDLLAVAVRRPPLQLTIPDVVNPAGEYQLTPRMVQLTGQQAVSALDVRPSSVNLTFSRLDTRSIRVVPRYADSFEGAWAIVDSIAVEPAQIRVTGPAEQVTAVNELFTSSFDLSPSDTTFERVVLIDTAGLAGLELSNPSVTVSGGVDRIVDRIVQNVRVDVGPGVAVEPDRVDVRLRGPERVIRSILPAALRVAVSIEGIPEQIPEAGVPVPLRLDLARPGVAATLQPAQVRLLRVTPPDSVTNSDTPPLGTTTNQDATPEIGA